MQYITPRDDTSTLSIPEQSFIRSAARGVRSGTNSSQQHQATKLLRLDGRSPADSRPMRMSYVRSHNKSECTVQFGSGTRSVASVRAELIPPPNADRPNDGQVKFNVDVGPMGCMGYEVLDRPVSNFGGGDAGDGGQVGSGGGGGGGGGDAPYAQRLKSNRILRILERTLLIGGAMDAEALCVQGGNWVWRLQVDVSLLDDGGNAVDACVLAAVAALRHFRLPEVSIGGSGGGGTGDDENALDGSGYQETTIIHSDDREPTPLPLHHTPLTATFALFADETGATTSVSALLDPSDREELACDGILSWSYNKYGEMCCLDFPGGCELRPRQLMSSAKLGKRRCVEICELLETALEEADKKAQRERMERLKNMNVNQRAVNMAAAISSDMDIESSILSNEDPTDAEARKEDEEYRLRALDYSSGHFAASVKEDRDGKKGSSDRKNMKVETSSLFHAILRSAQSSVAATDTAGKGDKEKLVVSNNVGGRQKEEPAVEIIAHRGKGDVSLSQTNTERQKEKTAVTSSLQSLALDSDEEEEIVQLQTEFSNIEKGEEVLHKDTMIHQSSNNIMMDSAATSGTKSDGQDTAHIAQKRTSSSTESKMNVEEDVDITDLSQALKKKKKKSKKR